ncbi:MAG: hypothetical protein JWN17_1914, partial [Frankiales bacterium]|nr:hypothetical protein [Frankiales bacterium]
GGSARGSAHAAAGAVLDVDGDRVLAARAAVSGLPYAVVSHRPEAAALAGATALARSLRTAGAALLVVLVVGGLVWRRTVGARRSALAREQHRVLALQAASPCGILELDLDLLVTGCNDAFLRLVERGREQVVGLRKEQLFHPDSPGADPAALAELAAGRRAGLVGHRLLAHAAGHAVPVQLDWGVVTDEGGRARSLVCVVTDVTEQHALRTQLELARERAEVLWRQAPIGVVEGTPDGTVLGTNAAFAQLLGYTPEELVGTPASALAAPEQAGEIRAGTEELKAGRSYVTERTYLAKDGRRVPVLTSATVLYDADGQVERFAGFVVDLSEVHAQRQALTDALAEVARQKAFTEAVLETVDVGIVYVDADGTGTTRNRAEREMSALPPTDDGGLPEAPVVDLLDEAGHVVDPDEHPLVRVLRGEDPVPLEGRLGPRGGPHRDVVVRASRITGAAGEVLGAVVALTDVTAERAALAALSAEREALAEAQRLGRLGSFSVDPATGTWTLSDQLYELWGHTVARPGIEALREQIVSHTPEELAAASAQAFVDGGRHQLTLCLRHAVTGEERYVVSTTEVVLGPDGAAASITGTHHDVTEVTEAEREARQARAFFEAALVATPDYTFITDLGTGAVVYGTPGKEVLGMSSEALQALGAEAVALLHPDDRGRLLALNAESAQLADGQVLSMQYRARHTDGTWRWLARRVTPFRRDDDGAVTQVLGVVRDVTELVHADERLAHAALHDTLTGLPNRRLLADRLAAALVRSRDTQRDVAVIYLDLDGFKRVNDGFGHGVGDQVLTVTAERVRGVLRPQDTVARVGGDEFVVLVEATDRPPGEHPRADAAPTGQEFAEQVARRIVEAVGEPIEVDGTSHVVTASVGVRCVRAGSLSETDTAEQVLADADTAMYDAKTHGKDTFVLFAPGLRSDGEQRRRVERTLRDALAGLTGPGGAVGLPVPRSSPEVRCPRLHPVFQPVFSQSGALVSFEALCRLTDEHGVAVSPERFIAVAEETGLVRRLGAFMLDAACAQLAAWRTSGALPPAAGSGAGRTGATMAVNVSAVEAQEPGFADRVRATLARHGLSGRDLVLELTETSLLQADHSTLSGLRLLRAEGTGIAIDDFGTGYASLRYLVTLPLSAVKIDGSFTSGVPDDTSKTRIVQAVSALAADLGLDCVVEGVETAAQRAALPASVQLQGYLLGRPVVAAELDVARLCQA